MDSHHFDYLIVGGGSAGCVLAARLSEDPNVSVALLEAGPADKSILIHVPMGLAALAKVGSANWKFSTTPQPGLNGRCGYQPRGKVLGGSSSINAMVYVRGQRQDYDHWAALGNAARTSTSALANNPNKTRGIAFFSPECVCRRGVMTRDAPSSQFTRLIYT